MPIKIAVLKETRPGEQRVALVPSVIDKVTKLGVSVAMQSGAGDAIKLPDTAFRNVTFIPNSADLLRDADIVLAVEAPPVDAVGEMREGAILISFIYAAKEPAVVKALCEKKITCFAMERVPRITRAQAMDALSSQAALAGYYAALLGATHLARILPRMTTAVGALRPATVLVMGLGVAGLQAIATAHRLGAIVEGYDVRPETKEQAASLGAKFVETGVDARGDGGYARELTAEEKQKVAAAVAAHIKQADIIITTASVPSRAAPKLISAAQAQQKLYEFVKLLQAAGVEVKFAMHPVAGRMPGHMDVLLAEAGVPYDLIEELEEVNDEFSTADVALVIGANDVVNPAARTNKASPIYGMPILNVDQAHQIYVVKRGQGKGYAGIENELFYRDNCNLVYGDAQAVLGQMIQTLKDLVPAGADALAA